MRQPTFYDRRMTWHEVDQAPDSAAASQTIDDIGVLLVRFDGEWFAVEDRCSHADCSFGSDGEVDGAIVICNCHGSEFDVRTGQALVAPATDPIRTFVVREIQGRLEVEL